MMNEKLERLLVIEYKGRPTERPTDPPTVRPTDRLTDQPTLLSNLTVTFVFVFLSGGAAGGEVRRSTALQPRRQNHPKRI